MYRIVKGEVHGVLTDYDLASWTSTPKLDYPETSQQQTGTPPYMANALLDGTDQVHLYRHDVESLFYIILILAAHYEIRAPTKEDKGGLEVRPGGRLEFRGWFETRNHATLGSAKSDFFTKLKPFKLTPSFKNFRCWLLKLQIVFYRGFTAKSRHRALQVFGSQTEESSDEDTAAPLNPPYNDETLGGHLTYSALIQLAQRNLAGKLEGLAIRYEPPRTPPQTLTSAAEAQG